MSQAELARIKWKLKKHYEACDMRGSPEDILDDERVAELNERRRELESSMHDKIKNYLKERALERGRR